MARILVIGSAGLLGSDLLPVLEQAGHEIESPSHLEFDITSAEDAARIATKAFGELDAVINLAAYTNVDGAEGDLDAAYGVNALGPGLLARGCAMAGCRLIHISTDYVFDGTKAALYTEEDAVMPLGVYGKSKLEGEEAIRASGAKWLILRTSWLFGIHGKSFPRTILSAAAGGKELRVIADQYGTPTYTKDLAQVIAWAVDELELQGLFHATGSERISWHGIAERTLAFAGLENSLVPISMSDWPTTAPRPKNSALDSSKLIAAGAPAHRSLDAALLAFTSEIRKESI